MINREYIIKLVKDKYKEWSGSVCLLSHLEIERIVGKDITELEQKFYDVIETDELDIDLNVIMMELRKNGK